MFKKQKEKLKQQIAFAKIDIKESAKKMILDAVSPQFVVFHPYQV